jgi:DNA-binding IclR family transcriptional regulator
MTAPESWFASRTMGAIELLAFGPRSAPQVAEGLQVHPRTARRLLNRLAADGYVVRSEDKRRTYAPTMRLVALAGQIVERSALPRLAVAEVERLHDKLGAAAHLEVPSYRSVLCLVHRSGTASAARPQLRELTPCHCSAAGKALLAFRAAWRDSVLSRPLERHTDRTIVDAAALVREASRTRARGYAVADREFRPDLRSIAAPVFDATGEAVAAVAVSGPVDALPSESLLLFARLVRESAGRISEALGYAEAPADLEAVAPHA